MLSLWWREAQNSFKLIIQHSKHCLAFESRIHKRELCWKVRESWRESLNREFAHTHTHSTVASPCYLQRWQTTPVKGSKHAVGHTSKHKTNETKTTVSCFAQTHCMAHIKSITYASLSFPSSISFILNLLYIVFGGVHATRFPCLHFRPTKHTEKTLFSWWFSMWFWIHDSIQNFFTQVSSSVSTVSLCFVGKFCLDVVRILYTWISLPCIRTL